MKYFYGFCLTIPFWLALVSAYATSVLFALLTVLVMFVYVGAMPFCRRRESLWLFVLWAGYSLPINLAFLHKYNLWGSMYLELGIIPMYVLILIFMALVCTCVEEVFITLIGRLLWPKQKDLSLPQD